jgi:hypothetical protein
MANALLYGFYQLKDLANTRAINVRTDILRTAIVASVAEHNAQINNLIGLFAQPTTDYQVRYRTPTNGRLQAGDENSRALPFKGTTYTTSFPIQKGDAAWGTNFITRQKMTVQQVNDAVSDMLTADVNWMRDHILAGLFYNGAGWTSPDPEWGDLTILGLANGDTTVYVKQGTAPATDTHYYAQAAAIADATNPYDDLYAELSEHPENAGGDVVTFIASDLVATTEALANFAPVADANVQTGSADAVAIGRPGTAIPASARLLGRVNSQWVAEWPAIPSGYGVALATGGPPPLAMRQDPEPELQGFVQADNREDFPYQEAQFFRRAGFGAWNRVGAVAFRIGNASWAIPTSFGSPMY